MPRKIQSPKPGSAAEDWADYHKAKSEYHASRAREDSVARPLHVFGAHYHLAAWRIFTKSREQK